MTVRSLALLLSLACAASCVSVDPDPDEPTPTPTPAPEELPAAVFVNPAEAEDLDPADDVLSVQLIADEAEIEIGGELVEGFAYNGQVPGPTLRAQVGDTLRVELENRLDVGTTIHWHGLEVPYAMDGVTWQTDPIGPGETFVYEFTLSHAGTFWYHPHFDTVRQVDRGLYGVLVVEDPAEPAADAELLLVFDDWGEHDAQDEEDDEGGDEDEDGPAHGHGSEPPDEWVVSGFVEAEAPLAAGSVVRLRMVNASNTGYLDLRWPELRQIASDQGLLPELAQPDAILLAPGDRAEAELLLGGEAIELAASPYSLSGGVVPGDARTVLSVVPQGSASAPEGLAWPWPGGAPSSDPAWTDLIYVFAGDPLTGEWLINGESYPDVTVRELPLGSEAIITVRNLSPTEHPFHLHGHSFEVLSEGGVPSERLRIEDTVNIRIREDLRIRLIADNPGDWMTHCHILPHAHGGMMTVLRVLDE